LSPLRLCTVCCVFSIDTSSASPSYPVHGRQSKGGATVILATYVLLGFAREGAGFPRYAMRAHSSFGHLPSTFMFSLFVVVVVVVLLTQSIVLTTHTHNHTHLSPQLFIHYSRFNHTSLSRRNTNTSAGSNDSTAPPYALPHSIDSPAFDLCKTMDEVNFPLGSAIALNVPTYPSTLLPSSQSPKIYSMP